MKVIILYNMKYRRRWLELLEDLLLCLCYFMFGRRLCSLGIIVIFGVGSWRVRVELVMFVYFIRKVGVFLEMV